MCGYYWFQSLIMGSLSALTQQVSLVLVLTHLLWSIGWLIVPLHTIHILKRYHMTRSVNVIWVLHNISTENKIRKKQWVSQRPFCVYLNHRFRTCLVQKMCLPQLLEIWNIAMFFFLYFVVFLVSHIQKILSKTSIIFVRYIWVRLFCSFNAISHPLWTGVSTPLV